MSSAPPESDLPAPAAIMAEQEALPPGTRFGELEIVRVLGVGGFGIVYLARDHALERDVALKEYMPASLATRGQGPQITVRSGALNETYAVGLRSFINEARLLAKFDHPSLVKVYRFWEDNATAYMVMPYLQGRTLRETRRAMSAPPDEAWMRGVLLPIMGALEVLHRDGVFHRDIAPDNILLPPDGPPVLLDFGAARRVISGRTQSLTAILKPSYAPIEQYAEMTALRQGPWTDIYALGAVVHALLVGAPPGPATARALQDELVPLASRSFPGVSLRFLSAIDWALAVRPQERPQSIEALRAVLDGRAEAPMFARTVPGGSALPSAGGASPTTGYEATQVAPVAPAAVTRAEPTFVPTQRVEPPAAPPVSPPLPAAAAPAAGAAAPAASRKGLVGAALAVAVVLAAALGWQAFEARRGAPSAAAPVAGAEPVATTAQPPAPAVVAAPAPAVAAPVQPDSSPVAAAPAAEAVPVRAPVTAAPAAPVLRAAAPAARPADPAPVAAAPQPGREAAVDAAPAAQEPSRAERARALREALRAQREERAQAQRDALVQARQQSAAVPAEPRIAQAPQGPLGAQTPGTVALGAPLPGDVPLGAAPSGPATAREACGSRVLVALWNCLQRECRRPRYAQQPECVKVNEERRQRELQ